MADEQHPKNDDHRTDDHDLNFDLTEDFTEPWEEEHAPIDTDFNEETAAEAMPVRPYAVDDRDDSIDEDDDVSDFAVGRGAGIFAVVLSILSLFFLPVLLGIAGIVVGFVARRGNAKALGNWAIGIGALSIIMKVFFAPLF